MNREFIKAVEELEKEKEISKDLLIEAIESALVSAYKKNYGTAQNVRVNIDREDGDIDVFMRKEIVSEVTDKLVEVLIEDARLIDPKYEVGDVIETQVTPKDFGRIAAQTAKQVVVQRIREAERGMIFDSYSNRQSEIINGIIQRVSNDTVFINMGKTEGILAVTEQVPGEKYVINSRIKVFIMDVKKTTKGPQVYLSRSHPGLVKRLFELEVPEIQDGVVEIKSISREAGSRTKMAVYTADENIDAVGACVGSRGTRVQAIVDELFGEKIDIINWSEDPEKLISSALSPAKVEKVIINPEGKSATVIVPDYQLSLAIGKEGQNVRLAAKLCGWKIDIKSHAQFFPESTDIEDIELITDADIDLVDSLEEASTQDIVDINEVAEPIEKPKKARKKKEEVPIIEEEVSDEEMKEILEIEKLLGVDDITELEAPVEKIKKVKKKKEEILEIEEDGIIELEKPKKVKKKKEISIEE